MNLKNTVETMITFPVHFSAFISIYGLLIFLPLIRPPVVLTLILVSALVWLSMFFGRILSEKNQNT